MLVKLLTILGLAAFTLGAALPPTTNNAIDIFTASTDPAVRIKVYSSANCSGSEYAYALEKDVCYALGEKIKSLRVIEHEEGLQYNSLHVYEKTGCDSGPVLQPLNDACSRVETYRSIKVVVVGGPARRG